jgi:hypothetical protein
VELGCCTMENLGVNRSFWRGRQVLLTGHTPRRGT